MKVVEITSSGYEDGFKAGLEVKGRWKRGRLTNPVYWAGWTSYSYACWPIEKRRKVTLEEVLGKLGSWTRDAALRYAEKLHQKKMATLPNLKTYPELEGMDEYIDGYVKGYAEAAGIELKEVLLEKYWKEIMYYAQVNRPPSEGVEACTEIIFTRTEDGPIFGRGWDDWPGWYEDEAFTPPSKKVVEEKPTLIRYRGKGYSRVSGINEKGFAGFVTGGGAFYEYEEPSPEIFPVDVGELILRYCATVEEAVEMLQRYRLFWGPCNAVVYDVHGNARVVEKSRRKMAVRDLDDAGVGFSTYAGCENEDLKKLCDTASPRFKYYRKRYDWMQRTVSEAKGNLSLEVVWKMLTGHAPGGAMCQHHDSLPPGLCIVTLGVWAVLLKEGRRLVRNAYKEGKDWVYPCSVEQVEVHIKVPGKT